MPFGAQGHFVADSRPDRLGQQNKGRHRSADGAPSPRQKLDVKLFLPRSSISRSTWNKYPNYFIHRSYNWIVE